MHHPFFGEIHQVLYNEYTSSSFSMA